MRGRLVAGIAVVVAVLAPAGPAGADPKPPDTPPPTPCIRDVAVVPPPPMFEGTPDRGPATVDFTFTVTSAGCAGGGSVDYTTYDVMTDASDLTPVNGTLTFAAGDLSPKEIVVDVVSDFAIEPDERFMVGICGATGLVRVVGAWGPTKILNDDGVTDPLVIEAGGHCSR